MGEEEEFSVSSGRTNLIEISSIEIKFQHFLSATVRNHSTYRLGATHWDFENDNWIIRENQYGCVCFAATFLVYWYNYNEEFCNSLEYAVSKGIQYAFNETIDSHDKMIRPDEMTWVTQEDGTSIRVPHPWRIRETQLRGFKEFADEGSDRSFWIYAPERWRGVSQHFVSFVGTVADFINQGRLLFLRKQGGRYRFVWDPSFLNNFNVVGEASHHVILYVKRGSGGGNDFPSNNNRPHQIWRLGADVNSSTGGRTTWREEEISVVRCGISGHAHSGSNFENSIVTNVHLSPDVTPSGQTNSWIEELTNSYVTTQNESGRNGCLSRFAVWKLKDLARDATAPNITGPNSSDVLLSNSTRTVIDRSSSASGAITIPHLESIEILKQVDGSWEPLAPESSLSSGDIIKVVIQSDSVENGTPIIIEIYDSHDDAKIPLEGEISGNTTELEFEMPSFIVPNQPNNQIIFQASVFDSEHVPVRSDFIDYI